MKVLTAGWVLVVGLLASTAWAQDDREALKKRILDAVEKKLKQEEERILKEVEKIIDEELAKGKGVKPSKHEPKSEPPTPKAEPAPEPKAEPPPPQPPKEKAKARGRLGINLGELSEDELQELGIKGGVRIGEVQEGSAAEKAGLQADDVIVTFDGKEVDEGTLPKMVQEAGAGTTVTLGILRDKKQTDVKVTLGRHPEDEEEPPQENRAPRDESELRTRIKKFLDDQEAKKGKKPEKGEPKSAPAEDEGLLALDDRVVQRMRAALEYFGVDVEQFLEQGKDDKWRLREEYRELFKGLNPSELFKRMMPGNEPEPEGKKPSQKEGPKASKPAWLGVQPEELTDDQRAMWDVEAGVGIIVAETRTGSPAEKVLRKGDVLLKVDGKALRGEEGLAKFMASAKPGQNVELTILRDGKMQSVKVTLIERRD